MKDKGKLELIAAEILDVLQKHGLSPDTFGVNLTLPHEGFEALAANYPRYHAELILLSTESGGVQWSIQVMPRRTREDSLQGAVLTPPAPGRMEATPIRSHLTRDDVERFLQKERRLTLRGADLHGTDLSRMNLYEIDLTGVDFQKADLREANLEGANMMWSNLQGADLRGANLNSAQLWRANLTNVALDETTRLDPKWHLVWEILNHAQSYKRDLRGMDLSGAYLRGAYLFADLRDADLHEADLTSALVDFADLRGANLTYTNLQGARLRAADLNGAVLVNANLEGADTSSANFANADLTGAKLPSDWKKPEDSS
jgi:uncharacterized protein YjbI with pentapeptide repeats